MVEVEVEEVVVVKEVKEESTRMRLW